MTAQQAGVFDDDRESHDELGPYPVGYARARQAVIETESSRFAPIGHDRMWRVHAACRDVPTSVFFPERSSSDNEAHEAKEVCVRCPVREDCLLASLVEVGSEAMGIWAGAGEPLRRALRRLDRTHPGVIPGCTCAFCGAVAEHFARLDGAESPALRSYGPTASHGKASTYGRGCRCDPCRDAKLEHERSARTRRQQRRAWVALLTLICGRPADG